MDTANNARVEVLVRLVEQQNVVHVLVDGRVIP